MQTTRHKHNRQAAQIATKTTGPLAAAALAAAIFIQAPSASAENFSIVAGGGHVNIDIQSIRERKFATIIRQQYDFSCGSAAVATLLTYHYNRKTSEADAFQAMWKVGNKKRIQTVGFSLLEMKSYLEAIGYRADGFKLSLDRIRDIGVPAIALVDINGYKHFVVIKGITEKTVMYGDPSRGIGTRTVDEFNEIWDGTVLIVRSNVALGKSNFNALHDWRTAPSGPFDRALDHEPLSHDNLIQARTFSTDVLPINAITTDLVLGAMP